MESKKTKESLIVFFKSAERGKVKTRLEKKLSQDIVLKVYQKLFYETKKAAEDWAKQAEGRQVVYYGSGDSEKWLELGVKKAKRQWGKDLGQRMQRAFAEELRTANKVCIVGSDMPDLNPKLINEAFLKLGSSSWVLGPTYDGGYYLIGSRSLPAYCLHDMTWSTEAVLDNTMRRLTGFKQKVSLLEKHTDIDHFEDLQKSGFAKEIWSKN